MNISEQKLPQRPILIKTNANEPLLWNENGWEPNEFIDFFMGHVFAKLAPAGKPSTRLSAG